MCFQYEVSIDLDILIYLRFMSALTLLKGLVITYFYKHACRTMALEKLLSKKGAPRRSVPSDTLFSCPPWCTLLFRCGALYKRLLSSLPPPHLCLSRHTRSMVRIVTSSRCVFIDEICVFVIETRLWTSKMCLGATHIDRERIGISGPYHSLLQQHRLRPTTGQSFRLSGRKAAASSCTGQMMFSFTLW